MSNFERIANQHQNENDASNSMPSFEEFRKTVEQNAEPNPNEINSKLTEIAEKYNYSEQLQQLLKIVTPEISDHYKSPELIIETLAQCPIFILEPGKSSSEAADNYLGIDSPIPIQASGGAVIIPHINADGDVAVKRAIIVRDSKDGIGTMVHEICHQAMSTNKEPQLEADGRIRVDIGLSSEYYTLDKNNSPTLVESKNDALEEMANSSDTEDIMKKIMGPDFETTDYGSLISILRSCPKETREKLQEVRKSPNSAAIIASQEKLAKISQVLDDYLNVPAKIRRSKELAGGDREKARAIRRRWDEEAIQSSIENLTSWATKS